jgi:GNAT superfamily N-acetyltransferase
MRIVDFNHKHIYQAMEIAILNYELERQQVPFLPEVNCVPDLTHFADNHLGVAALEGDQIVGYLCAYYPREDAFGTTNVRGTFTPIHAHGVIPDLEIATSYKTLHSNEATGILGDNAGASIPSYTRDRIYSLLYQGAAQKWVKEGIRSHGIALYTHDKVAINSFFYNGFGLRCIDAIRSLDDIPSSIKTPQFNNEQFEYCEVPRDEWRLLLNQHNALLTHLGNSPTFMCFNFIDEEDLYRRTTDDTRYFAVKAKGDYVAYVKISDEGENFATEASSMMNICGAYCDPNFRGIGIYHNLLSYLMTTLKQEGYQLLGVDCESFNPTARGFWLKYFTEYTHSVVRRIDDKAIK